MALKPRARFKADADTPPLDAVKQNLVKKPLPLKGPVAGTEKPKHVDMLARRRVWRAMKTVQTNLSEPEQAWSAVSKHIMPSLAMIGNRGCDNTKLTRGALQWPRVLASQGSTSVLRLEETVAARRG